MKPVKNFEFPEELVPKFKKAKKLEWLTFAYLISTALLMYLTMGQSQAMKAAWFEDLVSLTPSISFLIASRIYIKPANKEFPYGYHQVINIAYLCSAVALFSIGVYILTDSVISLVEREHPTIGTIVLFGYPIWLGYIMIVALAYGTIPSIFLGKAKLPISKDLHEKNLYTDAKMNKADWMTGFAAIVGIIGIGMGWWWTDAVAASLISLDILKDGYTNLKQAVFDLMNQIPKTVEKKEDDPLTDQVKETLSEEGWIKSVKIRLREAGHVYFGEAYVVPSGKTDLVSNIRNATEKIYKLNWRIQDFTITLVETLPPEDED